MDSLTFLATAFPQFLQVGLLFIKYFFKLQLAFEIVLGINLLVFKVV